MEMNAMTQQAYITTIEWQYCCRPAPWGRIYLHSTYPHDLSDLH